MILAGDVGGTTTRLGLFDPRTGRPRCVAARTYPTLQFPDLTALVSAFAATADMRGATVARACFGVAGPVLGRTARLTNARWTIDADRVARDVAIGHVALINDLEAMAHAVPALEPHELCVLQAGERHAEGNAALIAAGTGLGQALLHNVGGRFVPSPSEGGHADYAARTERDIDVLRDLVRRFGRAEVEHVVSGPGLLNLHRVTHAGPCPAIGRAAGAEAPAAVATAALERQCAGCVETLSLFVEAYGAEAGNLALRCVASGGLYVGGGIAPKILPALTDGRFMGAFLHKGAMEPLLARVPVHVILHPEPGLLGAAMYAASW